MNSIEPIGVTWIKIRNILLTLGCLVTAASCGGDLKGADLDQAGGTAPAGGRGEGKVSLEGIPKTLTFAYCDSPSLVKDGDYMALSVASNWPKALEPPPDNWDWTPHVVLISLEDFKLIWTELKKIDFDAWAAVTAKDLMPTPMDVRATALMKVVIDGKVLVNWSYSYSQLDSPLSETLVETQNLLLSLYYKRIEDPVLPQSFKVELLAKSGKKGSSLVLVKEGDKVVVTRSDSDATVHISEAKFRELWILLQSTRALFRWYLDKKLMPTGDGPPAPPLCAITVTIEGVTVNKKSMSTEDFYDRSFFDDLWETLSDLF